MSTNNKAICNNSFIIPQKYKPHHANNIMLPHLCEPIWFITNPFACCKSDLQMRERFKRGRLTRNSQKNMYRTQCPMLNQLEFCPMCGPQDFKYHKTNNIPNWYLCKEIFSGHMYPCGHYKTNHFLNCLCTFCCYHRCCQKKLSNICWKLLGYGNADM